MSLDTAIPGDFKHSEIRKEWDRLERGTENSKKGESPCTIGNRLILENGTYVNASPMKSYRKGASIIAASAPPSKFIDDFYTLIIEQGITIIVNLVERLGLRTCPQYWPMRLHESNQFDLHSVVMESELPFIKCAGEGRVAVWKRELAVDHCAEVELLHFVDWVDMEAVDDFSVIFALVRYLHERHMKGASVLVHCSAGVGRTGTLIGFIDTYDQVFAKSVNTVSPRDIVREMRQKRRFMVYRPSQYESLFEFALYCLAEREAGNLGSS